MEKNGNSIFIKLPKNKEVVFIENYRNALFIKLKMARKNLKELR